MGLSLLETTGRAEKERAENCSSALPYSRSCRRSGRSPALPYAQRPHEHCYFIMPGGGLIFKVKKGTFSKLISWYNWQRWVHFRS
jgi:hypothetical protein